MLPQCLHLRPPSFTPRRRGCTPCRARWKPCTKQRPRRGPLVPPDHCTVEGRILVSSPRHCLSHGWIAKVRVEHGGSPAASAIQGIASPRRSPLPIYTPIHSASPTYSPVTPQYTPMPLEPPSFELPRTRAVHRGALPFYDEGESSYVADQVVFSEPELAPPPPPQAPAVVDELGHGAFAPNPAPTPGPGAPQRDGGGQSPPGPARVHPDRACLDRGIPARPRGMPTSLRRGGGLGRPDHCVTFHT
ncbi:hypothetical protein PVAP13_4KG134305 [Panicum virgatum]|uniref:Uncharacterized protein n=1 Tax=Panicum virgatum TaxID=38727 RepID=A0A8T0TK71_PANVG|nr:hypothetical protein PVAP13_4KG134305 [Panicum virgatum]